MNMLNNGELPFVQQNFQVAPLEAEFHTSTKVNQTGMRDGYAPFQNKIFNNQEFGRKGGRPWAPPGGQFIEGHLRQAYGSNIFVGSVFSKRCNTGKKQVKSNGLLRQQPFYNLPSQVDLGMFRHASDAPSSEMYVMDDGKISEDWRIDCTFREARDILNAARASGKPFYLVVHYAFPDAAGHDFGRLSPQYRESIRIILQDQLPQLMEIAGPGVDFFFNGDHGFDHSGLQKQHNAAPWTVVGATFPIAGGNMRDIAPTIMRRMGLPVETFTPPLLGRDLSVFVPGNVPQ
jgi:hypothetical protein